MSVEWRVRSAEKEDAEAVLALMQALAEFEGYSADFRVTLDELVQRCFVRQDFQVLVADAGGELLGMLVYYEQPFTYDLKPWFVIKELYVRDSFRGAGVGRMLMKSVAGHCYLQGGSRLRWEVLTDNLPAQRFYGSLGAQPNTGWQTWHLGGAALRELAVDD
ncbi:MAG: GNAT family N-acetyltransferase [Pseudomonadota bacterium]